MCHATILLAALAALHSRQTPLQGQTSLTLEDALLEAHTANAQLPLAALEARIGLARLREARGALGPRLSLDGDLHGGNPEKYAGSDGRLQLLALQPIYDGGALRAGVAVLRAETDASQARYRIAEKDLEVQVRVGFATVLELDTAIAVRREGVSRLRTYLAAVQARLAAGEGITNDLLKTRVQLGDAEAAVADAVRLRDQARLTLNDLLGRDPSAPLVLAPLPPPTPPPDSIPETWALAPDVRVAEAEAAAARSGVAVIAADRRPHLDLEVNAGAQPAFGTFGTGINNGQGWGTELFLSLNWPLFDAGGYRARRDQARLRVDQAGRADIAARRQARLAWSVARVELTARYGEVEARARTAAVAEDSYLASQSLYRGGAATALDVLEAYATWVAASEAVVEAVFNYHVAEAELLRWGTP